MIDSWDVLICQVITAIAYVICASRELWYFKVFSSTTLVSIAKFIPPKLTVRGLFYNTLGGRNIKKLIPTLVASIGDAADIFSRFLHKTAIFYDLNHLLHVEGVSTEPHTSLALARAPFNISMATHTTLIEPIHYLSNTTTLL